MTPKLIVLKRHIDEQIEAFNAHDAAFASFYATSATVLDAQCPVPLIGRAEIERHARDMFTAFPDVRVEILRPLVDRRRLAYELKLTGTHKGSYTTPDGDELPGTNCRVSVNGAVLATMSSRAVITNERRYLDMTGLLNQLGLRLS